LAPPGGIAGPRLTRPSTEQASRVFLHDNLKVVGVVVDGKSRAYTLQGMTPIMHHVVDDLVGKTPVTVTYCPSTGCVRVFTGDGREPLPIAVSGYRDGLLLTLGEHQFDQKTGRSITKGEPPPIRRLPYEETTWGEWKKAHPDTDVFEGG
jgi:hypothetical protein